MSIRSHRSQDHLDSRENINEQGTVHKNINKRDMNKGNNLPESKNQIIKRNQIIIFSLTFTTYSLIHATRTVWSASQQFFKQQFVEVDGHILGILDSCFLISYAISMSYLSSHMRKAKVQHVLGAGIIGTSICFMLFFVVCQFKLNPIALIFIMLLNGITQSVGWPCAIQSLGNWFNKSEKGLLMGLWATCTNFGNIIGYLIMYFTINQIHQNWTFSLLTIGLFTLSIGIFVYSNMESYPQDLGISMEDFAVYQQTTQKGKQDSTNNTNPSSKFPIPYEKDNKQKQNKIFDSQQELDQVQRESKRIEEPANQTAQRRSQFVLRNETSDNNLNKNIEQNVDSNNELRSGIEEEKKSRLQGYNQSNDSPYSKNKLMERTISEGKELEQIPLQESEKSLDKNKITVLNAWVRVPELAVFSLVIGGLKGIIYGKLFWLPLYLSQKGFQKQASLICSMSELGTLIGGLLLGYLVDKFKAQTTFITSFIAASTVSMLTIHFLPALENPLPYYLLILLAGIGLGGPFSFIGGAKSIEIANNKQIVDQKNITALVAGMLEGFGSILAAIVQLLVPFFGLSKMFILFSILSGLSCIILLSRVVKEIKNIC